MKNTWKELLAWSALLSVFFALVGFTLVQRAEERCTAVVYHIDENDGNFFVSKDDLQHKLATVHERIEGERTDNLKIKAMEEAVKSLSEVKDAQVYLTIDGKLNVVVSQRRPIVRVIPKRGSGYYIDEEGKFMPLSKNYAAKVLVVNGEFTQRFLNLSMAQLAVNDSVRELTLFDEIYTLASFIDKDSLWKAQIQHAYVDENEEFTLFPRVGNHNIGLGNTTELESKFRKLLIFYMEGMPYTNWNMYETINLRFKNQVVCTKKTVPL